MRKSKLFSFGGGGGGGSVADGVLQISGGVPLDTTLRSVTDQVGGTSILKLSDTLAQVGIAQFNNLTAGAGVMKLNADTYTDIQFHEGTGVTRRGYVGADNGSIYMVSEGGRYLYFGVGSEAARFDTSKNFVLGYSGNGSARLHVRGDGSNPIARFEDNSGVPMLRVENSLMRFGSSTPFGSLAYAMTGTTFSGNNNGTGLGFYSQFSIAGSSDRYDFGFGGDAVANTAGTVTHLALSRNFAAGAGSANYRPLGIYYTINNSGAQTGTATGIYLRGTETALNSMKHDLMDLGVGSTSRFMVLSDGRMRLAAVTAAAATTALGVRAAVQGDFFSVSTTDATFTAVGLWYYDGTNWIQL